MLDDVKFYRSVFSISDLPKDKFPEVIICGRSNVGKSTFLNSLFNKKSLAKTSSTPGKTQSINYYLVDNNYFIVDLPGYGYARTSKSEREKWKKLISEYFNLSKNIVHVFHLIDSRHKPTELDMQMNALIKSLNVEFSLILSKVDKLNQSEEAAAVKIVKEYFPGMIPQKNLYFYSSQTGKYKKNIVKKLQSLFSR